MSAPAAPRARVGFRWRVLLWMLLIGLVPGGLVTWQGYRSAREAVLDAARTQTLTLVRSRRSQIDHWLEERASDLKVLGCSRECVEHVREHDRGDTNHEVVCSFLDTFQTRTRSYHAISLYDRKWERVAGTPGPPAPVSETLRRGPALPDPADLPLRGLPDGGVGMTLINQLSAGSDPAVGYVVAELDLSRTLWPLLAERIGLGRRGVVYLVGAGGRYLSPPAADARGRLLLPAAGGPWPEESGTRIYDDHRGVPVIGGYARLTGRDWVVIAEVPLSEALAELATVRRRALGVSLVTLLVILGASLGISRGLARPLRRLAEVAGRISAGSTAERVPVDGDAEAREVGHAFNAMLDALAESQEHLARTAALAAVGEVSASVVHEMRNPLSSVKLNLQALAATVNGDPDYAELGQIALTQVDRLERMLGDLLKFGKPVEPALVPTAIETVFDAAERLVAEACVRRGVAIERIDETTGATFLLDPDLLAQAVANLMTNAIEASPESGTVRLSARAGADGLTLEIADQGPGVAPGVRDEIFRPFVTTRKDGTGLGLAIVKKVAELHGGSVALVEAGEGARFRLQLPGRTP